MVNELKSKFDKLTPEQKSAVCFKKASSLHKEGKFEEAISYYSQAIAFKPDFSDAFNNMAVALRKLQHFEAAVACYARSLTIRPDNAGTYSNMGNALNDLDRIDEALKAHHTAAKMEPENLLYLYNMGLVQRDKGQLKQAIKTFDKVLGIDPKYRDCPWDRSLTHLMNGSFKMGFDQYESRWELAKSPPRKFSFPRWDGEKLEGKTLFIHREQGFGDAIQFLRLIKPIKEKYGGKIILECQPDLVSLFNKCPDLDGLVPYGQPVAPCDFWIPMMSLPRFLKFTKNQIPGPYPCLPSPETSRFSVRKAKAGGKNIGIVWKGSPTHQNDRRRSVDLKYFLPLVGHQNVTLFSLQKGDNTQDIQGCGAQGLIVDAGRELKDFNDTAALISQLDLIISVDTSVVHLASSMGKPVWLMLPYTPDWRWMLKRTDSPWYPDMRIFRQEIPGDWEPAFKQMLNALNEELTKD